MNSEIQLTYELVSRLRPRRLLKDPDGIEVGWFEPGRRLLEVEFEWRGDRWQAVRTGNRWTLTGIGSVTYHPLRSLLTLSLRFLAGGSGTEVRFRGSAAAAVIQAVRAVMRRPIWTGAGVGTGGSRVSVTQGFRKPTEISMVTGPVDPRLMLSLAVIAGEMRSSD